MHVYARIKRESFGPEGIVAKKADSLYDDKPNGRSWIKIKNPNYTQKEGRADLFKQAG